MVNDTLGINGFAVDDAGIDFQTNQSLHYYSIGNDHIKLTLKMTSFNKVQISIPQVWLKSWLGDSVRVTANMTQKQ